MDLVLEILKYTLPALVVALVVYVMLKTYFDNNYKLKVLDLKSKNSKEYLPLKLQAYERLTLFVHRTSPENLIPRNTLPNQTAKQLKKQLLQAVQQEFEHNITQQVYVSNNVWNAIVGYKAQLIKTINIIDQKLGDGKTAYDLSKVILEEYHNNEELLTAAQVNDIIKAEIKHLFIK